MIFYLKNKKTTLRYLCKSLIRIKVHGRGSNLIELIEFNITFRDKKINSKH